MLKTELIHYGIDDLYEVLAKRHSVPTMVIFIHNELNSMTIRSKKGRTYFEKFFLGVVGVYDSKITKKELQEDIDTTKQILKI